MHIDQKNSLERIKDRCEELNKVIDEFISCPAGAVADERIEELMSHLRGFCSSVKENLGKLILVIDLTYAIGPSLKKISESVKKK